MESNETPFSAGQPLRLFKSQGSWKTLLLNQASIRFSNPVAPDCQPLASDLSAYWSLSVGETHLCWGAPAAWPFRWGLTWKRGPWRESYFCLSINVSHVTVPCPSMACGKPSDPYVQQRGSCAALLCYVLGLSTRHPCSSIGGIQIRWPS
jgi:hypothetical protein